MPDFKVHIHHWRYEDGSDGRLGIDPGWYCWVYMPRETIMSDRTDCRNQFEAWVEEFLPSADIAWRFNSGDPMFTLYIADDAEATLFCSRWM